MFVVKRKKLLSWWRRETMHWAKQITCMGSRLLTHDELWKEFNFPPWGINVFSSCHSSQWYFVYTLGFIYELRSYKFHWRWSFSLVNIFSTAANTREETTECCIHNCLPNVIHSCYTSKHLEHRLAYFSWQCGML